MQRFTATRPAGGAPAVAKSALPAVTTPLIQLAWETLWLPLAMAEAPAADASGAAGCEEDGPASLGDEAPVGVSLDGTPSSAEAALRALGLVEAADAAAWRSKLRRQAESDSE